MRSKIILITSDPEVKRAFEDILSPLVEEGLELYILEKTDEVEVLIQQEKPQLIFCDEGLALPQTSVEIVPLISKRDKNGDKSLTKPIKAAQLLAITHKAINLATSPLLPPM